MASRISARAARRANARKNDNPTSIAAGKQILYRWWQVFKIAVLDWQKDKVTQLAAALAYYTLFSFAPLLLVLIAVAGTLFGDKAVAGHLYQELRGFLGKEGAAFVQEMVARANQPGAGTTASLISIAMLLYGASNVFSQLKEAMDTIWDVGPHQTAGLWNTIKYYLLSFGMVLSVGFVLLVSMVLHTILATAQKWLEGSVPGTFSIAYISEMLGSLVVTTLLFALMLKYLPDTHVAWRHVWLGAFFTAVLFAIGKFLFGWYLSRGTIGSTYGAAGSVIVVLLWAYYSSLIFLFGAEFTHAHARVFGKGEKVEEPRAAESRLCS